MKITNFGGARNVELQPLREQQRIPAHLMPLNEAEKQQNELNEIMLVDEKQFAFENGFFMGSVDSKLNNKFSLWWHAKNTSSLNGFIKSVVEFVESCSGVVTDTDKDNLRSEYGRFK